MFFQVDVVAVVADVAVVDAVTIAAAVVVVTVTVKALIAQHQRVLARKLNVRVMTEGDKVSIGSVIRIN